MSAPECWTGKSQWEGDSRLCTQNDHEAWLADITHWRDERRIRIGYNGSRYDMSGLKWTQSSFIQPQMMVQDRYFTIPSRASTPLSVTSTISKRGTAESMLS
jgi:iron(II)-dependent oxidoreductase